ELDVSNNTALEIVSCSYNQLTSLDVSNNTALTLLECGGNQLTELDLSKNTALTSLSCELQKRSGLKVKRNSDGYYEVNMKDYVSKLENIDADSINEWNYCKPLSYDKETGIITFSEPIRELCYGYMTHSPNNDLMYVTITNPLSIAVLERFGSNTYGIICDMTENSYLDSVGNPLDESAIHYYSYSGYSKLGLAADGNSRLIIRVKTNKPGTVSFSFNEDIGAKLESLSRAELSASDQLNTTEMGNDVHQVSAVLVAPESFPKNKNFPSDTFKVHVKFTDEDGKVTEDDLELKIEAAPVMLIHGLWGSAEKTFGSESGPGIWHQLKKNGFTVGVCNYDGSKGPSEILNGNYNRLYLRLWDMFDKYSERGIVCTKADIVAFGMGGLIAEKYLSDEGKDSNDGNNWSVWSYKQGMVRRVITIATPHRGTRWADLITSAPGKVLSLVDKTTNPLDLPLRLLMNTLIAGNNTFVASQSGLRELRTDTARDYVFPSGVPMYAIYGDISGWEDSVFEDAFKDIIFQSVAGVGVATAAAAAVVPIAVFAVISIPALATMAPALITFAPVMVAAITGTAMAIEMKDALKLLAAEAVTVFKTAMFDGDGHDLVVSVNSAAGGFGSASSGWKLLHWSLPKRDEVGKKIVSLLRGSADKFKIFGTGDNASNFSVSSNVIENSAKVSTNQDSTESFKFIEALNLRAYVDNPGTVTFSVTAQKPTSYDVYCAVCGDEWIRLFKIPSADKTGRKFEVKIPLTSDDIRSANIFCF
ncbi:MAG: hypothetical protein IJG36_06685, partial [Synergistaceae bacterium]|nr:hypothetical protein [Synergistaceae bacterium]